MNDIKQALSNALAKANGEWSDKPAPAGRKLFAPTNNVSRETFKYIRDHKGCTPKEATRALSAQGFKATSVSSLITQMVRGGLIKQNNDTLHAVVPEYRPLKNNRTHAKPAPRKAETTQAPQPVASADELLSRISVLQARALYDKLKTIFGG